MFIRTPIYSSQPGAKEKESEVQQDLVSKILAAMDARDAAGADFSAEGAGGEREEDTKKDVKDKTPDFVEKKEASEQAAREKDRDGYLVKILKYVPIELSSVFAGLVALAFATNRFEPNSTEARAFWSPMGLDITPVLGIFLLGLVLTPLYFFLGARKIEGMENRPTWWFYLLSPLAFTIWTMAINNETRRALDRGEHTAELFLALGALLIPAIDEVCLMIFGEKKEAGQTTSVSKLISGRITGRPSGGFAEIMAKFKLNGNNKGGETEPVAADSNAENNGTEPLDKLAKSHSRIS